VDVLRPELARHRLSERALGVLRARERGESGAAAHAGGGAGEDDGAALPLLHVPRRLAANQERREAGHLPDLGILAARGFGDRKTDVGADVVHRHLDGPHRVFNLAEELDHLFLAPGIAREPVRLSACIAYACTRRRELFTVAASQTRDVPAARKTARDRRSERVAGADHQSDFRSLFHFLNSSTTASRGRALHCSSALHC
jgi:hypothetical protein